LRGRDRFTHSLPLIIYKARQRVPKVAVSGMEYGFLPAGQRVSKVAVSGMEYGFCLIAGTACSGVEV
jgi:hypothetical protein